MRKYVQLLLLVFPLFLSSQAGAAQKPVPMVNGDCSEYPELSAKRIDVGHGIELHIYDNEHYVWLCYTYPKGSVGVLDMKLKTARLAHPLNIHVSAQLGEWPADRDDLAPKTADSDIWWNQNGWYGTFSYRSRDGTAREIQLAKKRFGNGDWQMALTIYGIVDQGGTRQDYKFPADGSYYTFTTR